MNKFKINRYFLYGAGALSAFAPLAVVIACGETETKEEVTPTPSMPTITTTAFKPNAASTHAALTWEGIVSVAGDTNKQYQAVQYLSGNFATEAQAKAATTWSAELPKTVDFVPTQRFLWARALAAEGFNVDPLYLNLTETSGLQSVKSDVDALTAVTTLKTNLSQAVIIGDSLDKLALSVSVPTALPVKLEVQFNDDPWFDAELFTEQISRLSEKYTTGNPLTIKARLVVDPSQPLYVFKQEAPRVFNTDEVKRFLGVGASLSVKGLDASGSASHDKLTFKGSVEVVGASLNDYEPVEYLTGDVPDQAKAESSMPWSTSFPTYTVFVAKDRYLWARALPKAGAPATSQPLYRNVTGNPDNAANPGSRIREVKANINVIGEYTSIDLTKIKLSGVDVNAFSLTETPNLTAFPLSLLDLEIQVNSGTWVKAAALSAEIQKLAASYVAGQSVSVNARLSLNASPTLYLFTPPTPQAIDTTALVTALGNAAALDTSGVTVNLETSTQNQLVWNNTAVVRGAGKDKYALEYLATELETIEAANAAEGWSSNLPASVGFDGTKRHFYVRIRPLDSTNTSLTTYTVDVTAASQITKVKSNVNELAEYKTAASAFTSTQVVLTSYKAPAANPSGARTLVITGVPVFLTAPVVAEFSFDGATWITYQDGAATSAALAKFVTNRADLNSTPVFKARLALRAAAAAWASLTNAPEITLTLSDAFKQDLVDAAPEVVIDLSAILKPNWSPIELTSWKKVTSTDGAETIEPAYDDSAGQAAIAALPETTKAVVEGFEYLMTKKPIDTLEEAMALEKESTYDQLAVVKWTSDSSLLKGWFNNSSAFTNEYHLYTRVKLATNTTKKYKFSTDNILEISFSSKIAFTTTSVSYFRSNSRSLISQEDFNAINTYIKSAFRINASESTKTRVVFEPLPSANMPNSLLNNDVSVWVLFSPNSTNFTKVDFKQTGSFTASPRSAGIADYLVVVVTTSLQSNFYIPEHFYDASDISFDSSGGAHIALNLTEELKALPAAQ